MHAHQNAFMKAMTIREVPDDLYELVAARAARHRRSLQQEALALLDRARLLECDDALDRAAQDAGGRDLGLLQEHAAIVADGI